MNRYSNIVFLIFFLISFGVHAQVIPDSSKVVPDTLKSVLKKPIAAIQEIKMPDTMALKPFKPDPMKVVWMGAIIPGYGQILNRKFWKLPLVYGGFLGCAYALAWNGSKYQSYKTAYRDITDTDPATNTFLDILPPGLTIDSPGIGGINTFTNTLKQKQENFRRYRDLSIIATVGYYALTLVDAYVDAQLYDFDISPDLSLRFQPTMLENSFGQRNTFGMQFCINLK
ncbi:MAG TPA: DUF5683 domain-containing protein [Paludibacter sp.]|nr:DUF5683 domain-containing protein [Paludibacter sp.]